MLLFFVVIDFIGLYRIQDFYHTVVINYINSAITYPLPIAIGTAIIETLIILV